MESSRNQSSVNSSLSSVASTTNASSSSPKILKQNSLKRYEKSLMNSTVGGQTLIPATTMYATNTNAFNPYAAMLTSSSSSFTTNHPSHNSLNQAASSIAPLDFNNNNNNNVMSTNNSKEG